MKRYLGFYSVIFNQERGWAQLWERKEQLMWFYNKNWYPYNKLQKIN